jgi:hypothetical protein
MKPGEFTFERTGEDEFTLRWMEGIEGRFAEKDVTWSLDELAKMKPGGTDLQPGADPLAAPRGAARPLGGEQGSDRGEAG